MKVHGGDIYGLAEKTGISAQQWLDFSANINPLGIPEGVRVAMMQTVADAVHYPDPDCTRLRTALAAVHGVRAEMILCGNGGADLIFRIAYAGRAAGRPWKVLVPVPTFLEYEQALNQAGAQVVSCFMGEALEPGEEILDLITPDIAMMFLCTPNNPTGILPDPQLLKRIAERTAQTGTRLVVDESFLEFVRDEKTRSMISKLESWPHVVVLRSFTKMYAIPGIRLGYAVSADTGFLKKVAEAGQTWPVNAIAASAGLAALKEQAFVEKTIAYVERERQWMKAELEQLGAQVWDGQANYLLFRLPGCTDLYERLLKYQIVVRRCCNYCGLTEEYYRVAVKRHDQNELLIRSMKQERSHYGG